MVGVAWSSVPGERPSTAIAALADAGAASIVVVNRTADRAERAAALAGGRGRVGGVAEVADADLVVNGTPIGMHHIGEGPELPFDPALVGPGQLVLDMVYDPLVTPTVRAAQARGATAVNGLGMLVHQAAHAFRHWTGEEAPAPRCRPRRWRR